MRIFVLIISIVLLSGCVMSSKSHHFKLVNNSSKTYDDFNVTWCFNPKESSSLEICSKAYWTRSQSIGVILPLFPQFDRDSRLAYDHHGERIIEFKNLDTQSAATLSNLNGIQLCSGQYSKKCETLGNINIEAETTVWLKIPDGESHEFSIKLESLQFSVQLREFSKSIWHLVSV